MEIFGWLVFMIMAFFTTLLYALAVFNPFKPTSTAMSDVVWPVLTGMAVISMWYVGIVSSPFTIQ